MDFRNKEEIYQQLSKSIKENDKEKLSIPKLFIMFENVFKGLN